MSSIHDFENFTIWTLFVAVRLLWLGLWLTIAFIALPFFIIFGLPLLMLFILYVVISAILSYIVSWIRSKVRSATDPNLTTTRAAHIRRQRNLRKIKLLPLVLVEMIFFGALGALPYGFWDAGVPAEAVIIFSCLIISVLLYLLYRPKRSRAFERLQEAN